MAGVSVCGVVCGSVVVGMWWVLNVRGVMWVVSEVLWKCGCRYEVGVSVRGVMWDECVGGVGLWECGGRYA